MPPQDSLAVALDKNALALFVELRFEDHLLYDVVFGNTHDSDALVARTQLDDATTTRAMDGADIRGLFGVAIDPVCRVAEPLVVSVGADSGRPSGSLTLLD